MRDRGEKSQLTIAVVDHEREDGLSGARGCARVSRDGALKQTDELAELLIVAGFERLKLHARHQFSQHFRQVGDDLRDMRAGRQQSNNVGFDAIGLKRAQQRASAGVGFLHRPVAINDHGGIGRVLGDHLVQDGAKRLNRDRVQRRGWKDRRKPRRLQQLVARAERQEQARAQSRDHISAGLSAPRLQERDVLGRHIASERQF